MGRNRVKTLHRTMPRSQAEGENTFPHQHGLGTRLNSSYKDSNLRRLEIQRTPSSESQRQFM